MKKILKNKKGETLVETLAAILIFTMASVGLYTMILSSNHINTEAKENDEHIRSQLIIAESAENHSAVGNVTMTLTSAGVSSTTNVNIYGDAANGELYSYFKVH